MVKLQSSCLDQVDAYQSSVAFLSSFNFAITPASCNFPVVLPKKQKTPKKEPPPPPGGGPFWHFFFMGVFFRGGKPTGKYGNIAYIPGWRVVGGLMMFSFTRCKSSPICSATSKSTMYWTLFESTLPRAAAKLVLTRPLSAKHLLMHLSMVGRIEPLRCPHPCKSNWGQSFPKNVLAWACCWFVFPALGCRDRNPGFPIDISNLSSIWIICSNIFAFQPIQKLKLQVKNFLVLAKLVFQEWLVLIEIGDCRLQIDISKKLNPLNCKSEWWSWFPNEYTQKGSV